MTDATEDVSRRELLIWAVVFLVPIAGLVWEFGTAILSTYPPPENLPIRWIARLEVVMFGFVIVLGGGTLLAFAYAVTRYAGSDGRRPEVMPTRWRQGTFLAWIALVIAVLLIIGTVGATTLLRVDSDPAASQSMDNQYQTEGELTYKVVGVQWTWMVGAPHLPAMQRRIIRMPANTTIHLRITSQDVIHSFAIQELGVKKDAVPGQWNHYSFVVREPGRYQINCAELCGAGHSLMTPTLVVLPRDEYANWVVEQGGTNPFQEAGSGASGGQTPTGQQDWAGGQQNDTGGQQTDAASPQNATSVQGNGSDGQRNETNAIDGRRLFSMIEAPFDAFHGTTPLVENARSELIVSGFPVGTGSYDRHVGLTGGGVDGR